MKNKQTLIVFTTFLLVGLPILARAAWHFQIGETSYDYQPSDSFTVEVKLSGAGMDIDAFGFNFNFPDTLLQFEGSDFTGTLVETWPLRDTNEFSSGIVKVAGLNFSGVITSPAEGIWVKLNFTVKSDASGNGEFSLTDFGDDLLTDGSTSTPATINVNSSPALVSDIEQTALKTFELDQNYPNPFNMETAISYQLAEGTHIKVIVYNVAGRKVRTLIDSEKEAGIHTIRWDGRNDFGAIMTSGVYIYKLESSNNVLSRKMILVK